MWSYKLAKVERSAKLNSTMFVLKFDTEVKKVLQSLYSISSVHFVLLKNVVRVISLKFVLVSLFPFKWIPYTLSCLAKLNKHTPVLNWNKISISLNHTLNVFKLDNMVYFRLCTMPSYFFMIQKKLLMMKIKLCIIQGVKFFFCQGVSV